MYTWVRRLDHSPNHQPSTRRSAANQTRDNASRRLGLSTSTTHTHTEAHHANNSRVPGCHPLSSLPPSLRCNLLSIAPSFSIARMHAWMWCKYIRAPPLPVYFRRGGARGFPSLLFPFSAFTQRTVAITISKSLFLQLSLLFSDILPPLLLSSPHNVGYQTAAFHLIEFSKAIPCSPFHSSSALAKSERDMLKIAQPTHQTPNIDLHSALWGFFSIEEPYWHPSQTVRRQKLLFLRGKCPSEFWLS